MRIIKPEIHIEDQLNGKELLAKIERAGRTCYKSEDKVAEGSAEKFIGALLRRGHESVIEHGSITVRIICDRGVSHEIVRHRIASYSQESTRYCNYAGDKFGNELTFILPCFFEADSDGYRIWEKTMQEIETAYVEMIEKGIKPEEARSILPNSLKTELVMTMNLREWRHFLKLRTDAASHPQIREVAYMVLAEFKKEIPVIFDDITGE